MYIENINSTNASNKALNIRILWVTYVEFSS
jgi:hypothetical protein